MTKTFKTSIKILSVFLIVLTVMMCYPFTAIAAVREAVSSLDESEVPEIVGYDEAVENGYIDRLFDEESDLYSLLFGNLDGSKTRIIYDFPVKYIDEFGNTKDKSNEIVEKITDGVRQFVTASNDVITTFSEKLSDGVSLNFNDVSTKMVYVGVGQDAVLSDDGKKVTYVINDNISLEYALTYSGYKEDIVVKQYTGQTHFDFLFYTSGMSLVENGESYSLVDSEGNVKAVLGDVIAFTADERNNTFGEIKANAVIPDQLYKINISVDSDWLKDENTAYPIRIDPTLEVTYANNGAGAIQDVTINSVDPISGTSGSLCLGKYASDNSVSRILMRFPSVDFTDFITPDRLISASVSIRDLIPGTAAAEVSCYRFNGNSWSESGATWSSVNANAYTDLQSTHTISYANGVSQFDAHLYVFDITDLAKQWVAGTADQSKGILFKASDAIESATDHVYKTFASYNRASYRPSLEITYIDAQGVNTTYDYDTQTLGEKVNIKTNVPYGNILSTHTMDELTGTFPITPALVYNSSMNNIGFFDKYGLSSTTYGIFGIGWKLNLVELIILCDDGYIYVDDSGAEYYFTYVSNGKYSNEALNATLTVKSDGTYTLDLNDDAVRSFNSTGLLTSLKYNQKTYTYNYSDNKLNSITLGDKTLLKFVYSNSYLSKIQRPVGSSETIEYSIAYTSNTISSISDVYGNVHSYSNSSSLFQVYNSLDGFGYVYSFTNGKVSSIAYNRKIDSTVTEISNTSVSYVIGNNSKVTSVSYTSDNKVTYVLDEKLRTANIIVTSADGSVLYDASAYSYDEDKVNAYIIGAGSENLLTNSSFENTSGWSGSYTKTTEQKLLGANSVKLSSNGNSVYRSLSLSAGSYAFSAYVKFDGLDKITESSNGGVRLVVKNSLGTVVASSEYLCGSSNESWIRLLLPFSVTASGTYTVSAEISNASGTVYVECAQLEKGENATTYNSLLNGEFENGVTSWSGATSASTPIFGSKSASVSSAATQTVALGSVANNRSFAVSAWAKAASGSLDNVYVKLTFATEDGNYEVSLPFGDGIQGKALLAYDVTVPEEHTTITDVTVSLVNESGATVYFDNALLSFGSEVSATSDSSGEEPEETETQTFDFVSYNNGTCTLMGIGTYEGSHVVIPSVSPDGDTVTTIDLYAFSENTSIKSVYIPDSVTYIDFSAFSGCTSLKDVYLNRGLDNIGDGAFSYCSSELKIYYAGTTSEWNAVGLGMDAFDSTVTVNCNSELIGNLLYTYTRDANDYITSTKVEYVKFDEDAESPINSDDIIFTSATYDSDGNLTSYTDENGNITKYKYNKYGDVIEVIDAKQTVTKYDYTKGQLTSVSCGGMTNTYTYTNGLLTSVTHTGTNYTEIYTFVYNVYGNVTSVKVGSQILVTYTYLDDGKGNLSTLTYANGDVESYTYDSLGNQTAFLMNNVIKYSATYDLYGYLLFGTDSITGTTARFYYDEYGYLTTFFTFDSDGNIITNEFTDTEATINEVNDVFGRITQSTLTASDVTVFIKNYNYDSGTNNCSSYQISSESFSNGSTEQNTVYNYTYDALGNLTKVKESGIIKVQYTYDALSQLVREDNAYAGKSYTYSYDGNGNITSKKTYAYTTGTLGSVQDTVTYGYTDTDWKDKLTSYDGVSISYDASGNPLNWANTDAEFSWTGKQLDSITYPDGSGWSFKYNASGLRTHKEFSNGYETITSVDYTWIDGQLAKEYRIGTSFSSPITLEYYYDGEELIGFNYNGTDYYYGKTNNGEIRYIYNASGTIVTTYLYDAWGTPISTTGSLASTIGEINPFRYKSYYYDEEIGFYYLQSRYYDSEVGRFLNADGYLNANGDIVGFNIFAYCSNNPVMYVDYSGEDAIYVADTNKLLFVGHAYVWIETPNGWYKIQYYSPNWLPNSAKVSIGSLHTYDQVKKDLQEKGKRAYAFYLEGDFTASYEKAKSYYNNRGNNGYDGKYNLITNNCLHFVKDILMHGISSNMNLKSFILQNDAIVPVFFFVDLQNYRADLMLFNLNSTRHSALPAKFDYVHIH